MSYQVVYQRNKCFDFHVGHIILESKGGATKIDNLIPLCARCNLSMSDNYTIPQFSSTFAETKTNLIYYLRILVLLVLLCSYYL